MISVPEFVAASSIPRLVHDSAHHLYSRSALALMRDLEADVNVKIRITLRVLVSGGAPRPFACAAAGLPKARAGC
jgi:hypothetical protein